MIDLYAVRIKDEHGEWVNIHATLEQAKDNAEYVKEVMEAEANIYVIKARGINEEQ
jgi:hypothetical protein